VADPKLYDWYSAEEAISLFGAPEDGRHLCDGQWVIFPKIAICLAEIGKAEQKSYFQNGARFCWVADKPYQVNNAPLAHFVPAEVIAPGNKPYSIRLFARRPRSQSQKYLYIGELAPHYVMQFSLKEERGLACYELMPTLPSRVWLELGGLRSGDLDVATVDRALDRLRRPTAVEDRLDILQQIVNFWHGPIRPEDGMSDAEMTSLPIPAPLRFWYRWAGKRAEIMTGQNTLFVPRDFQNKNRMLQVVNGRLLFYVEDQGVYQWATLQHGDDPAVFGRHEAKGRWANEGMTLSEHLILMCLFEAVMSYAGYGASASWLDEDQLAAIVADIPPVAIRPWRWGNTRFFAGRGAFVCVADNPAAETKKWYSVHVAAKTEQPLQFLKPLLDKRWEYVAI
jgi:hypothetical protein